MKSITVKVEECFNYTGDFHENGVKIISSDEDDEATIFDLRMDESSKLIPRIPVDELWEKFKKIDIQKVFWEDENIRYADGFSLIVELGKDNRTLTFSFNNPNMKDYKNNGCLESCKFLKFVKKFVEFVNKQGIYFDFEIGDVI